MFKNILCVYALQYKDVALVGALLDKAVCGQRLVRETLHARVLLGFGSVQRKASLLGRFGGLHLDYMIFM